MNIPQQTGAVSAPASPQPDARPLAGGKRTRPLTVRLIAVILIGGWIVSHVQSGATPASGPAPSSAPAEAATPMLARPPEAPLPDAPQRDVYDDSQAQAR